MLGEILDVLKEAQDLHESFASEDYSQDVFISTIEKFASDLKEKCHLLLSSSKEALTCEENVLKQTSEKSVEEESSIVTNDPAERIGVKLNESQNNFLIALGPCQPILECYPMNQAIAKSKQNLFTSKWYESMPFLEYSPTLDRAFCFACSLFGEGPRTSCSWTKDGANRWDKIKGRGKSKQGKLVQHFTSAAHKASVHRFDIFSKRSHHVDVALSNARKQLLAQEERERLHNREVIKVILDCCRYLSRQALAFHGGDDLNGNFRQLVNLL
jgi:uncharacterized protein YukE